ncbi:hypothetical protein HQ586_08660 [Candidatus Bathyarchaeota archaeon]|nr:hypothetical protein [Candidatus Bathyarchaeota archaeon]
MAERIPEVISEVTGNELIIAPAGDAIQALPAAQALIGLVCIVCLGLTVLSLRKTPALNQLKI